MEGRSEIKPSFFTLTEMMGKWYVNIVSNVTEDSEGYVYNININEFDHLPSINDVLSVCGELSVSELGEICEYYDEDNVSVAKSIMLARVTAYDQSEAVNSFRIGNMTYWLDKATRAGLLLRLQAEQAVGKTTTTLWAGTIPITLPMTVAMQFLYALENYASECYDRTAQSIAEIGAMDNVEDILAYDYESGYPERLVLEM